jgi:hypothetical protein
VRGPQERQVNVDSALEARIDAMLRRDIMIGVAFAALTWLALGFTFVTAARVVDDRAVTIVIAAAGLLLGAFNTAALASLIRRYRAERVHVYGEDIHHLDAARAARRSPVEVGAA